MLRKQPKALFACPQAFLRLLAISDIQCGSIETNWHALAKLRLPVGRNPAFLARADIDNPVFQRVYAATGRIKTTLNGRLYAGTILMRDTGEKDVGVHGGAG